MWFFLTVLAQAPHTEPLNIPTAGLPILEFGAVLTFIIRIFFIIAGIFALLYALMGGMEWITSEGEKEEVEKARDKIVAAIVGLFILIMVLTIIWTIETVIFRRTICFGISCSVRLPTLRGTPPTGGGGGGGGQPTATPVPTSCRDYCISLNESFTSGVCALDLSADPEDCPSTHNERGLPSSLQSICSRHPNEKCCCSR